jgi:hypothetical protein
MSLFVGQWMPGTPSESLNRALSGSRLFRMLILLYSFCETFSLSRLTAYPDKSGKKSAFDVSSIILGVPFSRVNCLLITAANEFF